MHLELEGLSVVEEAVADAIAAALARGISESWKDPAFIDLCGLFNSSDEFAHPFSQTSHNSMTDHRFVPSLWLFI